MCGRFVQFSPFSVLKDEFGLTGDPVPVRPSYNIAPSRDVLAVFSDDGYRLAPCRWGLLPPWAKDPAEGHRMINARAETLAEKPSFKGPFARTRCLVVADGFYEWKKGDGGKKTPYYIRRHDGRPMGFAALYGDWKPPEGGETLRTCAIVTTDANPILRPIHDRMPAILTPPARAAWLDRRIADAKTLLPLLAPADPGPLEAYIVGSAVNSPSHDRPENIEAADPRPHHAT